MAESGVYLHWIPLGAGGSGFVRFNGRVYEWIVSRREKRSALDLYHTALRIQVPEGRFVIETTWPRPDLDGDSRGVVVDGSVFSTWLGVSRIFRYEVRRWSDGLLPDADQAVDGPQLVMDEAARVRDLLELVELVPPLVWGRDPVGSGDMWNSNSVVSWLLAASGTDMDSVMPPRGGRAPGWDAGVAVARAGIDVDGISPFRSDR